RGVVVECEPSAVRRERLWPKADSLVLALQQFLWLAGAVRPYPPQGRRITGDRSESEGFPVWGPGYFENARTAARELGWYVPLPIVDPHVWSFGARRGERDSRAVRRKTRSAVRTRFREQGRHHPCAVHPRNGVGGSGSLARHIDESAVQRRIELPTAFDE